MKLARSTELSMAGVELLTSAQKGVSQRTVGHGRTYGSWQGKFMFSQLFAELEQGKTVDLELLQRLFDLAMTKKLGVVKLPPQFWMQDPKINPRADHLLQVALLLDDRERCDMAISVLAVELAEKKGEETLYQRVEEILTDMLTVVPADSREQVRTLANTMLTQLHATQNP